MTKVPGAVSAYMAKIGAKGGKNGKGKPKRRGNSEHYKKLVAIREAKRQKKT